MKMWIRKSYVYDILLYLKEGDTASIIRQQNDCGVDGFEVEFRSDVTPEDIIAHLLSTKHNREERKFTVTWD